jgi:3-oxoacyl-[acyl-carrier protein] reductase
MSPEPPGWLAPLTGQVVAVTGAASGIGRATALLASRLGAAVTAGDLDEHGLDCLAGEPGPPLRTARLDIRCRPDIESFLALAAEAGPLDGLVCSAGIVRDVPALALTDEDWGSTIDINLTGTFRTVQRAAALMRAAGRPGSIVTVSSGLGAHPARNLVHYSASKAGVIALTKGFALELAEFGIRVNTIAPGTIDTPMLRSRLPANVVDSWNKAPLGRIGTPADVAAMAVFLLSGHSSWITGQVLHVNGGTYMP